MLEGVNLDFGRGITGLVGVNGAGKTTLLSIAAGALKPSDGEVKLKEWDLYSRSARRKGLTHVALMPQRFAYPRNFRVHEFVEYLGYLRGLSWREARTSSTTVLEEVGLTTKSDARISDLSGGMLRRVGLAQALVSKPDVLLLDEPTTGLDPEQRVNIRSLIKNLADSRTVVLSSHLMEDIEALTESIVILHAGRVVFNNSLDSLLETVESKAGENRAESAFLRAISSAGSVS
ncbi:ABC transporter ATP-binding protein [Micromonospora sp. NPDC007208]|uniref:ABC transporter ATP-binding protein n=1 Tax=Micromonospora sp. NPDC007208 TaxID=3364236 RepID=UPI0036C55149